MSDPYPGHERPKIEHQSARRLFYLLAIVATVYAFVAGLHTITDYDLGWQLATGRWIVQHHQIPRTDVLSYTAAGREWMYPAGAELAFYALFLAGGYGLLSWLGAVACALTVALLLRRGTWVAAAIAILAVPRIAARTAPRAELFTTVLFAVFLTLLWEHYDTGRARLWALPVVMIAWVNLHLGFIAGFGVIGAYIVLEVARSATRARATAVAHLKRAWPWFIATTLATLLNPWGWGIYAALVRQQRAMAVHAQWITEWASTSPNWHILLDSAALRDPRDSFVLLLGCGAFAIIAAMLHRRAGEAVILAAAAVIGFRYARFQALFACLVVVIGGAMIGLVIADASRRLRDARMRQIIAVGATALMLLLAGVRSVDLITNRTYMRATTTATFGPGLSWWFPERAAAFIEREQIPGNVFNSYDEGGYLAWRLGPNYRDYIDGRAIPFGAELFRRQDELLRTSPDSPEWTREANGYGITMVVVSLARYDGLQFFPVLRQFCESQQWRPVYLDEVSAVFLRRRPDTEALIEKSQVDCARIPLPAPASSAGRASEFNRWANAAAVLSVLGRDAEAWSATEKAMNIFPENAIVHFIRANLLAGAGRVAEAEHEYRAAAEVEPTDAIYIALARLYSATGRPVQAIAAWERAAQLSANPYGIFLSLGYTRLQLHEAREALAAFDESERAIPAYAPAEMNGVLARLAEGRAAAWVQLGDLGRATEFQRNAVERAPDQAEAWGRLASLLEAQGRTAEAEQARSRAAALGAH